MRLAIISPYPPSISGIGQYGFHLSRLLAQSGHFSNISVLTGRSNGYRPIETQHPIVLHYGWQTDQLSVGWVIPELLQRIQPDLVWFNLGVSMFGRSPLTNLSGFLSVARANQLGLPTIVTMHELPEMADLRLLQAPGGPLARIGAHLMTRLASNADVICLTIQRYAEWLAARDSRENRRTAFRKTASGKTGSFQAPHVRTKYLHIPLGPYRVPEMLAESERPELLFFTTIAPFKGLEILLEGFRILKDIYPDLRLTVAGAEHIRFPGYMQSLRKKYPGLEGVRWLGQVSEDNVRALFAQSRIVVLPYTASTGASSVMAQAAMWGRSVVASDLAEIQSVAQESRLCLNYFNSGSVASLVAAIRQDLDFPLQRDERVRHNFQVSREYQPESMCHAYLHAFNRALEVRRSPKRIMVSAAASEAI